MEPTEMGYLASFPKSWTSRLWGTATPWSP